MRVCVWEMMEQDKWPDMEMDTLWGSFVGEGRCGGGASVIRATYNSAKRFWASWITRTGCRGMRFVNWAWAMNLWRGELGGSI